MWRKFCAEEPPYATLEGFKAKFENALEPESLDKPGKHFYSQQFSIIWPGGQVNRDCTTKRQTSERELDKFWKQVDLILEPVVKASPTSTHEFLQAPPASTLERTPTGLIQSQ